MNIKSETTIDSATWDNVCYDKKGKSIDFYNETDSLFVYGVDAATFIRAFRNATCAGCNCAKLQDMDLPDHAKDMLREIAAVLKAWDEEDMRKTVTEAAGIQ